MKRMAAAMLVLGALIGPARAGEQVIFDKFCAKDPVPQCADLAARLAQDSRHAAARRKAEQLAGRGCIRSVDGLPPSLDWLCPDGSVVPGPVRPVVEAPAPEPPLVAGNRPMHRQ